MSKVVPFLKTGLISAHFNMFGNEHNIKDILIRLHMDKHKTSEPSFNSLDGNKSQPVALLHVTR